MPETVKNKDADKAKTPKPDDKARDQELDTELEGTFPASDPPSSTQREETRDGKPSGV